MPSSKYSPVPGSHKTPYICKRPPRQPSPSMLKWIETLAFQILFTPCWGHLYCYRANWSGPDPAVTFTTNGPNIIWGPRNLKQGTTQFRFTNTGRVGPATILAEAFWIDGAYAAAVLNYKAVFPT